MASASCFLHHHATISTPKTSSSSIPHRYGPNNKPNQVVCRAQIKAQDEDATSAVSRRLALSVLIGAAAIGSKVAPADAAYGESANIFGKPKTNTDFLAINGDGFKILVPSKWNPSKEVEFPGQVLRFEDNFDAISNISVMITPTDNKSITDFGSPEQFLSQPEKLFRGAKNLFPILAPLNNFSPCLRNCSGEPKSITDFGSPEQFYSQVDYLLGKQAYSGKTSSEGGFDPDAVATANILESSVSENGGKPYYYLSVLARTADGNEGGKHQLITATVSDGKLYICKAQAGDKRWFKGARKFVENAAASFSVA